MSCPEAANISGFFVRIICKFNASTDNLMLWKINRKTNQLMAIAAILLVLLLIRGDVVTIGHIASSFTDVCIAVILTTLLSLLMLYFMICILMFFKEKKAIIVAFIIYTLLDVPRWMGNLSVFRIHNLIYDEALGLITFLSIVYLFISSFKIKSIPIVLPYKLFSYSLIFMAALKLVITLAYPYLVRGSESYYIDHTLRTLIDCIEILVIITPISVLILIKRVNNFIKDQSVQTTQPENQ